MKRWESWSCLLAATCVLVACDPVDSETVEEEILQDSEFRSLDPEFCTQVYSFHHYVDVEDGVTLHVIEKLTPRSVLRFPRRAMLMLPGTFVTNEMYDMDIEGAPDLNALDQMAMEGYFAYAVTYEGYGESTFPDDGGTVNAERSLEHMGAVVEWIRAKRHVPRVDLMGASFGSSLAVALGGTQSPINRHHVGRLVLQALVYKSVTPLFEQVFFSPEVKALLENAPDGYVQTVPEMYGLIVVAADPVAAEWSFQNFPGVYATGPTLEGFDLPVFDASHGRARALQFWGDQDPITPFEDTQQFQAEYGGNAELVELEGAGHAPYTALPDVREDFWAQTVDFLDEGRLSIYLACE